MEKYDIAYILKNDIKPEELRYSLRSLDNFPHGRVFFYGGKPEGLEPDVMVHFTQTGNSKYARALTSFDFMCNDERLSDDFWLFNDDFFVMRPVTEYETPYDETLFEKIIRIEDKYRHKTAYSEMLRRGAKWLRDNGYDVKNYALHMPMLLNKEKLKAILPDLQGLPLRSIYGNVYGTGAVNRRDVKIQDLEKIPAPDADFLSTSDKSFKRGKVGEYIRNYFTEKSIYEVETDEKND